MANVTVTAIEVKTTQSGIKVRRPAKYNGSMVVRSEKTGRFWELTGSCRVYPGYFFAREITAAQASKLVESHAAAYVTHARREEAGIA